MKRFGGDDTFPKDWASVLKDLVIPFHKTTITKYTRGTVLPKCRPTDGIAMRRIWNRATFI